MEQATPIGLLGAYERDNFGDILFLERTRALLAERGAQEISLTAFSSTPELLTKRDPVTLTQAVRNTKLRGLWTVGGEVGSVAVYAAYAMIDSDNREAGYADLGRHARRRLIRRLAGAPLTDLAYAPAPSMRRRLRHLPSVLNSVGVTGLMLLKRDMRIKAEAALRDADYVSVREGASSHLLGSLGIPHTMAPDFVHTLRHDYPEMLQYQPKARGDGGYVLVQISQIVLAQVGVAEFAAALASLDLRGREIRLFVAGSAPGHDSVQMYERVREELSRRQPGVTVTISSAASALEKAQEIAASSLVIATSLHAIVIALSFDVPHVGFMLAKVSRYMSTWDDPMPSGVGVQDLSAAAAAAEAEAVSVMRSGLAARLADQAHDSATRAAAVFDPEPADEVAARVARRARQARQTRVASLSPGAVVPRLGRSILRPMS